MAHQPRFFGRDITPQSPLSPTSRQREVWDAFFADPVPGRPGPIPPPPVRRNTYAHIDLRSTLGIDPTRAETYLTIILRCTHEVTTHGVAFGRRAWAFFNTHIAADETAQNRVAIGTIRSALAGCDYTFSHVLSRLYRMGQVVKDRRRRHYERQWAAGVPEGEEERYMLPEQAWLCLLWFWGIWRQECVPTLQALGPVAAEWESHVFPSEEVREMAITALGVRCGELLWGPDRAMFEMDWEEAFAEFEPEGVEWLADGWGEVVEEEEDDDDFEVFEDADGEGDEAREVEEVDGDDEDDENDENDENEGVV